MIDNVTRCDVCGVEKGETNHWLVAITYPAWTGILFAPAEDALQPGDRPAESRYEDICGEACAHKRLSQFLSTCSS